MSKYKAGDQVVSLITRIEDGVELGELGTVEPNYNHHPYAYRTILVRWPSRVEAIFYDDLDEYVKPYEPNE